MTKRFTREDAINYTENFVLRIPKEFTHLEADFAYFVVRSDLPKVRTLMIPASVTHIDTMRGDYSEGPYGYRNNPFSEIIVDKKNKNFASVDGVLFSKDKKNLICYPCGKEGSEYHVPEGVESIKEEAFLNVEHLERIYLPKSLKVIEKGAFKACVKLKETEEIRVFPGAYMEDWDGDI